MMVLTMKRGRDFDSLTAITNYVMKLNRVRDIDSTIEPTDRFFECKTCNKKFPSFQALGGHRASHKKPRLDVDKSQASLPKPKKHECSICGLEFAMGQALGGHMRRHRVTPTMGHDEHKTLDLSLSAPSQAPIVKRSNSKKVLCLDLNLTPLENDLDFQMEKVLPVVRYYI